MAIDEHGQEVAEGKLITIEGIAYVVVRECERLRSETKNGIRRCLNLRRPRGKKIYQCVTLYENGVWSAV